MENRKILYTVFGIVFAIVLVVAAMEIFLRVATGLLPETLRVGLETLQGAYERELMRMPDPYTGNTFKPDYQIFIDYPEYKHWERTVDLGYGVGFVDDGINGSVYAVAIGDSFTEGVGVPLEEKWTELLEGNLGKDVVNMGVGSFSATQAVRQFEKFGSGLNPEVVIYQFNPTDFSEDVTFHQWIEAGSPGYYREFGVGDNLSLGPRKWANENLWSYRLLKLLVKRDSNLFLFQNESLSIMLNKRADLSTQNYRDGFEIAKPSILNLKDKAESVGAELVIIIIPLREQLYIELEPEAAEEKTFWTNSAMMEFCEENKIKCHDTTQEFKEFSGEQIYFTYDGHFNEKGYSLLAGFVQNYLESNNLVG